MKKSLQTGNRIIDLGEGKKIVDLDRGNLYLGEGRGEVFLYPEELKWLYYNYGYKQKSLFNPKYAEDEFNPEGIGELRYDNGKLDLIDASGNSYDITKEAKDTGFDFYRYIADLGLERTGLGGGEAGEGFEPEKERFRDKHPILFKSAAIGTGFLLPIGVCLGAYYIPNNPVKDIVKNIKKNIYKTENSIQTPVIAQNNSSEINITQTPEPSSISNQTPATTPEPTSKPSFTPSLTPEPTLTPYHSGGGSGGGGYKPTPTPEPKPNQLPIADAGGPYKAFVNKSVQLDASNSFDPDGKIMKYLWEYENITKSGPKVNFTFKEPGEHEIVLKVTDDKNATATNKTKVMIFTPYINKNDWDMKLQVPICAEEKPYYSGAASTKMILDYLKNASLNQTELYEFGHAHNFNPEILDLDPQGVKEILQKYKPAEYNFGIIAKENETELIKNICHWLNYEVPGVERPNSPSTIPTFGLYDNWMVIKGASTDINPNATQHPFEVADFVVNGFWVNDPGVKGLGNNSYKTAHELVDTYLKKINSSDLWKGKYVAVCEPKEKNANISIAPYKPNEKLIIDGKNKVRIKAMSSQRDFSYEDLIPPQLKNDSSFMLAYNNSIAREPIEVDRLDGPDYYLIPFDKEGNTSLVLVVDKNQGYFKEASWVEKPEKYLPINESEAVDLVLEKIAEVSRSIKERTRECFVILGSMGMYATLNESREQEGGQLLILEQRIAGGKKDYDVGVHPESLNRVMDDFGWDSEAKKLQRGTIGGGKEMIDLMGRRELPHFPWRETEINGEKILVQSPEEMIFGKIEALINPGADEQGESNVREVKWGVDIKLLKTYLMQKNGWNDEQVEAHLSQKWNKLPPIHQEEKELPG